MKTLLNIGAVSIFVLSMSCGGALLQSADQKTVPERRAQPKEITIEVKRFEAQNLPQKNIETMAKDNELPADQTQTVVNDVPLAQPAMPGFLDHVEGVDPWLANYVSSYSILPTRFQDKGPNLYSFDIDPDADLLNDDDYFLFDRSNFRDNYDDDDDHYY